MQNLRELFDYRDLWLLWTIREVRVRYKQSLLGAGWAVLQPLALTIVFTFVFSRLMRVDTDGVPYPIFAYAALVPWTLFASSLSFGIPSLINNMNLVSKIYFPREILPLASINAAVIDFGIALLILAAMCVYYQVWPGLQLLWLIPLLIVQILLSVGVTLLGSAALVFFRDVRFVVPLLTQIWMYATPVIYPISIVPPHLRPYYFLNPMAGIIDGYRRALVSGQPPDLLGLGTALIVSLVLLVLGYLVFKHLEPHFADLI